MPRVGELDLSVGANRGERERHVIAGIRRAVEKTVELAEQAVSALPRFEQSFESRFRGGDEERGGETVARHIADRDGRLAAPGCEEVVIVAPHLRDGLEERRR